jgi:hypothetical protein
MQNVSSKDKLVGSKLTSVCHSQDLDGIVLTVDSQHPETEKELEAFYMNFAQPNALTMKQCLTLGVQVVKEGAYGLGGWQGESLGPRVGGVRIPVGVGDYSNAFFACCRDLSLPLPFTQSNNTLFAPSCIMFLLVLLLFPVS